MNDLRSRIWVQTDGQLKTGRDVVIAGLLGADEMGFSTAPLVATGCVMMRACHLNTCPVGIATQNPVLRERFAGTPEHVVNFFFFVAEEARKIMAELGIARFEDLIGRVDLLVADEAVEHWKGRGIDLSNLLMAPDVPAGTPLRRTREQDSPLESALDWELIGIAEAAIKHQTPVAADVRRPEREPDGRRAPLALDHGRSRREGAAAKGRSRFRLHGSAGQSFGAWLAPGVELTLSGDANDYAGKGLSGGTIAIRPPAGATFAAEENVIVGNTVLYGATKGKAFFRGPRRRAVRRPELGRGRGRRGRRRPRLRVHDRRPCRRPRPHGPQLRRRDERRDRLRPRRGRRLLGPLQPRARRSRGARRGGRRARPVARRGASRAHRLGRRRALARLRGTSRCHGS